MKIEEIEKRVAEIAANVRDREGAHGMEDQLYLDVLRAIAGGHKNARQLAAAAIKAADVKYDRRFS